MPINTGHKTHAGRTLWKAENGDIYSERTVTVPFGDKWVTIPSVDSQGNIHTEDEAFDYVNKYGPVDPVTGDPVPVFDTVDQAVEYARGRTNSYNDEADAANDDLVATQQFFDKVPVPTPRPDINSAGILRLYSNDDGSLSYELHH